ncbi:hypothetical protein LOK49_Contig103G00002 [Camellia lanceoleosa]|nr:hypothetical protein LOK49_Contig103G00002 [Camellia lanceoleosa]
MLGVISEEQKSHVLSAYWCPNAGWGTAKLVHILSRNGIESGRSDSGREVLQQEGLRPDSLEGVRLILNLDKVHPQAELGDEFQNCFNEIDVVM